jgi:hypothetical protein
MPKPKKVVEQTVQSATSRTGSGSKRGKGGRSSGGAITITSQSPSGNVSNLVPTVRATVKAEEGNLSKRDIRLYLDGAEQRRFYYGQGTGNLSYRPTGMLSDGTHTVEIIATGDQGRTTAKKSWTFTVTWSRKQICRTAMEVWALGFSEQGAELRQRVREWLDSKGTAKCSQCGQEAWQTETADRVFLLSTGSVSRLTAAAPQDSSLGDTLSGLLNEPTKAIGSLVEPLKTAARDNSMVRVICGNCGNVLLLDHRTVLGEEAITDK